jgi:hypothetical protein
VNIKAGIREQRRQLFSAPVREQRAVRAGVLDELPVGEEICATLGVALPR